MPVIDFIEDNFTKIVVWQVSESKEALLEHVKLTPDRLQKIQDMPLKQVMEYLGLRACLIALDYDVDVHYDEKGKPYLDANHHLSITHSYGLVAVAISHYHIGIDVEKRREAKILNIANKFLRTDELLWIPENGDYSNYLHVIWGIKEGLYKLNGGNLWNFRHHYRVEPFELKPFQPIICWISDKNSSRMYFAYYKMIEDYYLIWVLDYEVKY